jgi:hypothetical protein
MPSRYTGVSNLLVPENCTMILIDQQPLPFAGVQNIDGKLLVDNVVGRAKTAKVFDLPTILTTVLEQRGGYRGELRPTSRRRSILHQVPG